jgi:hypothetical protein
MGAITEIFRTFGPEYIARFPGLPTQHEKVINAIVDCRSGEYGVSVYQCDKCRQQHHIGCCCGNRHCPECQYHKSRQWLEKQLDRCLPGNHFMLTFTVPEQIRPFCRSNQDAAYGAMFKAASGAIKKLVKDPKHIGADLSGFTGVLHTWGRLLQYHPHIHFIVPGGGLAADRSKWLPARNAFYLPVRALSKIFKAKFMHEMAGCNLLSQIDPKAWSLQWNVNCQPVGNAEASLKYLAPYVFRVAISNSRIESFDESTVTFSYRKQGSSRTRKTTLDVFEFMRRFLQHVLPSGFMKVRHYGFMSSNCKVPLHRLRLLIFACMQGDFSTLIPRKKASVVRPSPKCKDCGGSLHYLYSIIPGLQCRGHT